MELILNYIAVIKCSATDYNEIIIKRFFTSLLCRGCRRTLRHSPRISGLRMTEPIWRRACCPAFCTFTWESVSTSVSLGTMLGRQDDSCLGAQKAIAPSNSTEPGGERYCCCDCAHIGMWKQKLIIMQKMHNHNDWFNDDNSNLNLWQDNMYIVYIYMCI